MRVAEDAISPSASPDDGGPPLRTVFWRIVWIALGARVVLQVVGMASLAADGQPIWANALEMWRRWDAHHYLRIAEIGYVTEGEDALYVGFFPLFPLAVRVASFVLRDLVVSSLVVTSAASVGAGWLLYRLVRIDAGHAEAWRAVVLLFTFPTAMFLAAPYSEALFLFAVLGVVYMVKHDRFGWAAASGALATGTRPTGIVLFPVLAYAALTAEGWGPRLRRLAMSALSGAGLLAFALLSWRIYGTPFQYLNVQRSHWHQGFVPPWVPVRDAIAAVIEGGLPIDLVTIYVGRLLGIAFAVTLLLLGWRRLAATDRVYGWISLVLVTSTAWLTALPRFLLVIYPLFVVLAWAARNRILYWAIVVNGVVWQAFFMARYARGQWTF